MFSGSICITYDWALQIKRQHNSFIMNNLALNSASKFDFRLFNACRMYLQVFFKYDLSDPTSRFVLPSFLTGSSTYDSDCLWPLATYPPPQYWVLWRRWIKRFYPPKTPKIHFLENNLHPDQRLSHYLHVPLYRTNYDWYYENILDKVYHQ